MSDNVPFSADAAKIIATDEVAAVHYQLIKLAFGGDGAAAMVTSGAPLPVTDSSGNTKLDSLIAKDFATQTTLAAVLAKLSSDPATQTTLAAILAKLSSDPPTQTTLAAVLSVLQGTLTVGGTVTVANPSGLATTSTAPNRLGSTPVADTSSHTLFTTNSSRRGIIVNNRTSTAVYLKYGTAVTATSYDVWVPSGGYWEMPQPVYTGTVAYAFAASSGTGNLDATEVLV